MIYRGYNRFRNLLEKGQTTAVAEVERLLNLIEENDHLNAFVEVFAGDARARASVIDKKFERGTAGKLAGMVIGIKDNICFQHHRVSAGSRMLEGFQSLFSATVVERLLDEDAIIIGRLNCDEFAMGSANKFSAYGPVKNPHDPRRVPGGSSGGSSAALAAGLCHASLGSDTGGSIRQPAAFTGVWGLKPTYGRVSRHGLIAYASSFDQIGPLTTNGEDMALLLEVMAGTDDFDSTCSEREVEPYNDLRLDHDRSQKRRFAVLDSVIEHPGLDKTVREEFASFTEALQNEGHIVEKVPFPYLDQLVPIYYLLTTAEASSNLARYDGVHFGFRAENAESLEEVHKKSRTQGFGTEVKRRILLGTFVLSAGYYDAYYGKAQRARRLVKDYSEKLLSEYDFILSPTTPHEAFALDRKDADPTVMYLEDIYTVLANINGAPAISIPYGKGPSGLPLGIQLTGRKWDEGSLIGMAEQLTSLKPVDKS